MDKIFEREIRIHSKLDHENIVKVYDTEALGNKFYILMEYCPSSLHDYLNESVYPLDPIVIQKICFQLLCGLNYLHSVGVLHRDIKPLNILMSDKGVIKICDFGCAVESAGSSII